MSLKPSILITALLCCLIMNACNGGCINFKDSIIERYALAIWDLNHDGCINKKEADAVTEISIPICKVKDDYGGILELNKDESIETLDDLNLFLNLKTIGKAAFIGSIKKPITVQLDQVTTIGEMAFLGTEITSVSLPQVTTIGKGAFHKCKNLSSVSLPKARTIGSSAFTGMRSENLSNVFLPNATTIEENAFRDCSLTNIELPNVTTIGKRAFENCQKLSNVSLPRVTTIEVSAFKDCSSLTNIDLPDSITIDVNAFSGTPLLDNGI